MFVVVLAMILVHLRGKFVLQLRQLQTMKFVGTSNLAASFSAITTIANNFNDSVNFRAEYALYLPSTYNYNILHTKT
jgi:hypothetical protein